MITNNLHYLRYSIFILLISLLLSGDPPCPTTDLAFVELVIDGDTILLANGESVRYLGVDAPEIHHPTRGLECYGPEATARNRDLVEKRWVRLEVDVTNRDKYGRLLRYVYINGNMVNALLVREGYAYSYYYPPDIKYYRELVVFELLAEEEVIGLWEHCR